MASSAAGPISTCSWGRYGEVLNDQCGGDAAQVEPLAAREDRGQNLLRFGGGEHEFDVRGGSSRVLRRALKASFVSMWTSSMM
jgi:hypothetical protein